MSTYMKFWNIQDPVFLKPLASPFLGAALQRTADIVRDLSTQPGSVVLLTGEPGTGKSTLLSWLYKNVPYSTHEILLVSLVYREDRPGWLTQRLAAFMGVQPETATAANRPDFRTLMHRTATRMDELIDEKRTLIVAIDAAHLASTPDAWAEVAGFINLQALSVPCLSFVICGNPSVRATLAQVGEIATRICATVDLPPLSAEDAAAYLEYRVAAAGLANPFTAAAARRIHERSRGNLAAIGALAEHCLVEACHQNSRRIDDQIVGMASANLGQPRAHESQPPAGTAPGSPAALRAVFKEASATGTPPAFPEHEPARPRDPDAVPEPVPVRTTTGTSIRLNSLFRNKS